ncbi:MAG: GTP-binding protein [Planctomycetota bacterium]
MSAVQRIRNLGIVAHINAGKTTLSERMLFVTGRVRFMGEVDHGTAAMDYLPEEQRRGISIRAACTTLRWRDCVLNLVDTPGHIDFGAEVERTLRVLDGAVLVLDGVRGVESQTEAVWHQARTHRVPVLAFVNKLDRAVADWTRVLQSMRARMQVEVLPAVVPLLGPEGITGLIDVVSGTRTQWIEGGEVAADPRQARAALVEAAADVDASILEDFVHEREVDALRLRAALRAKVAAGQAVLVFAGSALRNRGVAELLDGIVAFLPSPLDAPAVSGLGGEVRAPSEHEPLCAFVFGSVPDGQEELAVARIYSGALVPGALLQASARAEPLRVLAMWRLHAEDREAVARAGPGDILALGGEIGVLPPGTTLFAPGHPIALAPTRLPTPVLSVVLEPRHLADRERLEAAVRRLVRADPALEVRHDPERDVLVLTGMGELHLEVAGERLRAAVGDCFRVGRPEVARRETVLRSAMGAGEWRVPELRARVAVGLRIVPDPGSGPARVRPGAGVAGPGSADLACAVSLCSSLQGRLSIGLRSGWPAHDLEVEIVSLEVEADPGVDLMPLCVEAADVALRRALVDADPRLLEPRVRLQVVCPHDALSPVLGDLRGKGVDISGVDLDGDVARVAGTAPLARMLGYATRLRSLTRGLGSFRMEPAGYAPAEGGEV